MTPSPASSLASTLARAVDRYGLGLLAEPDKLKLQLDVAFPDEQGDIAQLMAALADGIPQSQLVAHEDGVLDKLLRGQVDRLAARTGVDRERATWVVRTWALALALPVTGLDGTPAPAKRRAAAVPDFASVITPLSSTRRAPEAAPAIVVSPVADMPAVAFQPAAVMPPDEAPHVAAPALAAQPVVDTPASPSPAVVPKEPEPAAAARVGPISSGEASLRQPTAALANEDDGPLAGGGARHDVQEAAGRPAPIVMPPAPPVQRVAAALQPPPRPDAALRTSAPVTAPVAPAPAEAPARPAANARAAPRSVPPGGSAVPTPRGPIPAGRKAPLTPVPAIPLAATSGRSRQRQLAIASLVAVIAIVAVVTALRPDRDPRESAATAPTPGPSVAATSAKPAAGSAEATTATPAAGVAAPAALDAPPPVASEAGPTPAADAPAPAAPAPAPSPVPAQGVAETPSTPAAAAASAARGAASGATVPEPAALPGPPAIASVGLPRVTAGQPFRVVVELAPGSAPVASIERRVVSGSVDRAAESIPTAKLARTGSGALLLPFRAVAEPGRVVAELAPIGADGTRGAPRPVDIRVAAGATAAAPAACTRSSCGSVAAVRDVEGVAPGSVRGYAVVVRMDDRTIENVVLPTRPRLGQRMRKVGNRFVAG